MRKFMIIMIAVLMLASVCTAQKAMRAVGNAIMGVLDLDDAASTDIALLKIPDEFRGGPIYVWTYIDGSATPEVFVSALLGFMSTEGFASIAADEVTILDSVTTDSTWVSALLNNAATAPVQDWLQVSANDTIIGGAGTVFTSLTADTVGNWAIDWVFLTPPYSHIKLSGIGGTDNDADVTVNYVVSFVRPEAVFSP